MALAILSVHAPTALAEAVAADDSAALCLVPGVGKKTATRLLVELKSRLVLPEFDATSTGVLDERPTGVPRSVRSDVREALMGLGYGAEEISRVLADLPEADTSEALREALKRLAVT
jgi:Holliday junction DNA helicase RuvA